MQNSRVLAAAALLAACSSASALTIIPNYTGTVLSDYPQVQTAMDYAITQLQNEMSDNVTLHIDVTDGAVGLGASKFSLTNQNPSWKYSNIKSFLTADSKSTVDATAVNNLPTTDPTGGQNFWLVVAQAKALGVIPNDNNVDGTFTFASGSSYTFDPQNRQVAGKFDFIAVAEHELTEIMGRAYELGNIINSSGLGSAPAYIPYDLFRFTGNGARSLTSGAGYFSINNGATNLHTYNAVGGEDPQDWDSSIHDAVNAATPSGQENDLTPSDMIAMDVIGWDVANAASLTWNGNNSGGLWDTAFTANWNNHTTLKSSDVYRVGDNVTFDNTASSFNVLINANQYPGSVTVNSSNNYTFSSNVNAGILGTASLTKMGTGSLTITQPNGYTGGTSVSGGVLIVANPGALGTGGLALHAGGTTRLQAGLSSGVKLPSVTFDGSTNAWSGTLDVTNDKLVIEPTTGRGALLANLENQAAYGHTHTTGITSSTATAAMSVAVIDNSVLGRSTFGGVTVGSNSILIAQELLGDTNIDGVVNGTDLSKVLSNFGAATPLWTSGNFDGSATIDLTDLAYILNNFGSTYSSPFDATAGGVITNGTAADQAIAQDILAGSNIAAVPEPASVGMVLLGGMLILRRRRKA